MIIPSLCEENHKYNNSALVNLCCFAGVSPQIQLLGIAVDKLRHQPISLPIRSQIVTVFVGSVNFIFIILLIASNYPNSYQVFIYGIQNSKLVSAGY